MAKSLRYALVIVETTSIPLLMLMLLYILTGYQMLLKGKIEFMPAAEIIHTDPYIRMTTAILAYLHALAGLIILMNRRIRNRKTVNILEHIVIVGTAAFLAFIAMLEVLLRT